jgi:hypothetical protein
MSLKSMLKVADYYNVKYGFDKYSGDVRVEQTGQGKVAELLFSQNPAANLLSLKQASNDLITMTFVDKIRKLSEDKAEGNNLTVSLYPEILVASQNSGTITPKATIDITMSPGEKSFIGDPETQKLINELQVAYNQEYKKLSRQSFEARAKEISSKNQFYENLNAAGNDENTVKSKFTVSQTDVFE